MKAPLSDHLQQQLSERLKREFTITEIKQVYGGDINTTYIITGTGNQYFVKCNPSAPTDLFQKEYNGLELLKNKSKLQIPTPLLFGQFNGTSYLVMDCLKETVFTPDAWRALGEGIADMHSQKQSQFGLDEDNYIGSLPQSNTMTDSWAEFYAGQRVLPLAKMAFDKALCTKEDVKEAEVVCSRLPHLFPNEPPALLHGDLWSGNVMACADADAAIYDPAVYYGHREMDIAMTLLFGGFDPSFYKNYNNIYPLQNGWQQRVALCQLYPLLVHLNLFGSGYYGRVKSVLNKYK